jgi:hypothetical protein
MRFWQPNHWYSNYNYYARISIERSDVRPGEARLYSTVWSGLVMWDFVMDKGGAVVGFLRELRFPLAIYIPSASPKSSSLSPEASTIGQEWPQCQ